MMTLKYEGYLEENKLVKMIKQLCDMSSQCTFIGTQYCFPERKHLKYDVAFRYEDATYLVEYDGYQHYTNYKRVYTDTKKEVLATEHGYRLVRIPNFVQLTTETFHYFFPEIKEDIIIEQDFPHGFISKKNFWPPASFCRLGYARYQREMFCMPESVREEIIMSLMVKAKELNVPFNYIE